MIRSPRSDFWQVGIVPMPIKAFLDPSHLPTLADRMVWLPDPGPWRYLADPFGLCRNDATHVFVEAFDYRTKRAVIEHHELGFDLAWRGKSVVLRGPHHFSYPYIIEDQGEVFMLPECHHSGELVLYRAKKFPGEWVREAVLLSGIPVAEASVVRHGGHWWMFYTVVGSNRRDQRELHVAFADRLTGPWTRHALNPVLEDLSGARPGGTPFLCPDGDIILPVQDCSTTYGGAVGMLWFNRLTPDSVVLTKLGVRLQGSHFSTSHQDGCHTLSGCGDLTLVDAKQIVRSWDRHRINLQRRFSGLLPV
jgi:hypothetical protein